VAQWSLSDHPEGDHCALDSGMLAYMQRTTVKLPDDLDARLRHEAQRRGVTMSELTRQAIQALLDVPQGRRRLLGAGAGASGRTDISERIEEILASVTTRIKTVVRLETTTCELFLVVTHTEPDVLRMQLSPALWAIREAREAAGQPGPDDGPAAEAGEADGAASIVDQLTKLASLLESGLLTREEFDRLKASLLERP
jgi:predicted transcriptional regulator